MPYKKPQRQPFQGFAEFLRGKGLTSPKLAEVLGCSQSTAMRKLKNPESITLADIREIHWKGHIKFEDLREAIRE